MNSTYAQKSSTVQKAADTKAASVLDSSAQSESLQRKADMANNAAQRAEAPRPNNTGMPNNLKAGIESLSGFSMDNVRVHYNSSKPATVQALAYTQGTDIHVAPGQEKHLPHEAWHVAQQMAGRVSPTTSINGMPVNDNAALEHEADVMGEKAVQCKGRYADKHGLACCKEYPANTCEVNEKNMNTCQLYAFTKNEDADNRISGIVDLFNVNDDSDFVNFVRWLISPATEVNIGPDLPGPENNKIVNPKCKNEFVQQYLNKKEKYFISWPAYCTGDLPSMAAALSMGLDNIGIGIVRGAEGHIPPEKKMDEVSSYLGAENFDNLIGVRDSRIKITSLALNESSYLNLKFTKFTKFIAEGEFSRSNVRSRFVTRYIMTRAERTRRSEGKRGITDDEIRSLRDSWLGTNASDADGYLSVFLRDDYGIEESFWESDVEILWIRTSGSKLGAHYENDTSFRALEEYINKDSSKNYILAGDDKNGKAAKIATGKGNVKNLTNFWVNEHCESWGGISRTKQFRLYDYIKRKVEGFGHSLKHIGSMSGGLEALALIGHGVSFKGLSGDPGVSREEQYGVAGSIVNYRRMDFNRTSSLEGFDYGGFEKSSAKYYYYLNNISSDIIFKKGQIVESLINCGRMITDEGAARKHVDPECLRTAIGEYTTKTEDQLKEDIEIDERQKEAGLLRLRGEGEKVEGFEYLYSCNDIKNKYFIDISKLAAHKEKAKSASYERWYEQRISARP